MTNHHLHTWSGMLKYLSSEIDNITSESGQHSHRVAHLAQSTATRLKLTEADCEALYWGALLHDVGKIAIPREILEKKEPLTEDEWMLIELHPTIGANLVGYSKAMDAVAPLVLAHQEKFDGRGYPYGLEGEEIPLGARILAVVDAYDAMTDNRPYRSARTPVEAIAELRHNRGRHFDPQVVDAFFQVLEQDILVDTVS